MKIPVGKKRSPKVKREATLDKSRAQAAKKKANSKGKKKGNPHSY